jgi:hypothetical protein
MGRPLSSIGDMKYRNVYFKYKEKKIIAASRKGREGQKPSKVALKPAVYKIWHSMPLV